VLALLQLLLVQHLLLLQHLQHLHQRLPSQLSLRQRFLQQQLLLLVLQLQQSQNQLPAACSAPSLRPSRRLALTGQHSWQLMQTPWQLASMQHLRCMGHPSLSYQHLLQLQQRLQRRSPAAAGVHAWQLVARRLLLLHSLRWCRT
jgi:hypothetical protein